MGRHKHRMVRGRPDQASSGDLRHQIQPNVGTDYRTVGVLRLASHRSQNPQAGLPAMNENWEQANEAGISPEERGSSLLSFDLG